MKKVIKKTVAKAPVKKTVAKKPMMKSGGAKKPLRKAQTGTSVDPEYAAWKKQQTEAATKKRNTEFTPGQKGFMGSGLGKLDYNTWQMLAKSPANQYSKANPTSKNKYRTKDADGFYSVSTDPNESFGYPTEEQQNWQKAYSKQQDFENTIPKGMRDTLSGYKKGGAKKSMPKAQLGSIVKKIGKAAAKEVKPSSYNPYKKTTPVKDIAKGAGVVGAYGTGAYLYLDDKANKRKVAANKAKVEANKKKYAKGGSTFGMLSVKAGVDKNPNPTAADRIAGAKMSKKKMGGVTKLKKK